MRKLRDKNRDARFEHMFETRSEAWERVGLAVDVSQRAIRKARREAALLLPLLVGVLVVFYYRHSVLGIPKHTHGTNYGDTVVRVGTVLALLALGWAFARDV